MNPYIVFLMYLLAILGFVFVTLVMNRYLGPKPIASALKLEPFECGATPVDTRNTKAVPIKYYGVAIAFMLFDLETVFLFIWALGAQPLTGFMLFTFFIFVFLLVKERPVTLPPAPPPESTCPKAAVASPAVARPRLPGAVASR